MLINVLATVFDSGAAGPICDFVFSLLAIAVLNVFIDYFVKRKFVWYSLAIFSFIFLMSHIFMLDYLAQICLAIITVIAIVAMFVNMSEFRLILANKFSRGIKIKKKRTTLEVDEPYATSELYDIINTSVLYLSQYKIGALLSFVRNDNLTEVCEDGNNGTILKAPVNAELIETIFYKGTRLHDGAVIIKGNIIYAAAVMYKDVSTASLDGKYGTRHRAALAISTQYDAVTVVVSEETGNISIAYKGVLEHYSRDSFKNAFSNIMEQSMAQNNKTNESENHEW